MRIVFRTQSCCFTSLCLHRALIVPWGIQSVTFLSSVCVSVLHQLSQLDSTARLVFPPVIYLSVHLCVSILQSRRNAGTGTAIQREQQTQGTVPSAIFYPWKESMKRQQGETPKGMGTAMSPEPGAWGDQRELDMTPVALLCLQTLSKKSVYIHPRNYRQTSALA